MPRSAKLAKKPDPRVLLHQSRPPKPAADGAAKPAVEKINGELVQEEGDLVDLAQKVGIPKKQQQAAKKSFRSQVLQAMQDNDSDTIRLGDTVFTKVEEPRSSISFRHLDAMPGLDPEVLQAIKAYSVEKQGNIVHLKANKL